MLVDVHSLSILTYEEFDRENPNKPRLIEKAEKGLWRPDPPIIVSPMKKPYEGKYSHFLYNGHTRLFVSRTYNKSLNAFVVDFDGEIPFQERCAPEHDFVTLNQKLKGILMLKMLNMSSVVDIDYENAGLDVLLAKFGELERNISL
jgi:hypothetical protein